MVKSKWDVIDRTNEDLDDPDYPFEVVYGGEGIEFFSTEEDAERAINLAERLVSYNLFPMKKAANTDITNHRVEG